MEYSKALEIARRHMKRCEEKYQLENPCPKCGSHNVHIEIDCINGADMSGSEWCDDCNWIKKTNTFSQGKK